MSSKETLFFGPNNTVGVLGKLDNYYVKQNISL